MIYLLETFFDSKTLPDDDNLDFSGYNLVHSDHPPNSKRCGVCIYYKETLPLRVINVNYLNECIRFELKIGEKLCSFISLYRSPSQKQDEFDKFRNDLELNLDLAIQNNPYLVVILGDINVKSKIVTRPISKRMYMCQKPFFRSLGYIKWLITRLMYQILILHVMNSFLHPNLIWL